MRLSKVLIALSLVACRTVSPSGASVASVASAPEAKAAAQGAMPKGPRVKRSGTIMCVVADFSPVIEGGELKAIDFTCGDSIANGRYLCASENLCIKGVGSITGEGDRFVVSVGDEEGFFARKPFEMVAKVVFFKDDGKCNTAPVSEVTFTGAADDYAAMTALCAAATGDEAWGAKLPGNVCKDTADGPLPQVCGSVIREAVYLFLQGQAQQ